MRQSTAGSVLVFTLLLGTTAEAAGPKRPKVTARATPPTVALNDALPALPPSPQEQRAADALSTPPPAVAVTVAGPALPTITTLGEASSATSASAAPAAPAGAPKPTGFVFQLGSGALVPTGPFMPGTPTLGPAISVDVRLGTYVSQHVGLLVGFRGAYGHEISGCGGQSHCAGYSVQVPVLLQLAAKDRTQGGYFEIGAGFATTYAGSVAGATYALSSPVELKLGVGARVASQHGASVDFNVGMDIGSITSAKIKSGDGSYDGSVDGATHVVLALNLLGHFWM